MIIFASRNRSLVIVSNQERVPNRYGSTYVFLQWIYFFNIKNYFKI